MNTRDKSPTVNICLRLPPSLHKRLMSAKGDWMSSQDLIRQLLDKHLPLKETK